MTPYHAPRPPSPEAVGERLELLGIPWKAYAGEAGLSPETVSRWKLGKLQLKEAASYRAWHAIRALGLLPIEKLPRAVRYAGERF